jgi:uroporphyrinogen III methyltransferase / synthase
MMVYLIGAGPGDEELLTLKAQRALQRCTAVLYDRLVNPAILRHAPEDCELHYCGKRPGRHSKTQEEITDLLVTLARAGHVVGRLKGGDPYVFGRGGEEALRLADEGLPFEVIPGIPSPVAVLNYAGVPITHRGLAQSFHVFTGTSADSLDINWSAAAASQGTLVFLMGLGNIAMITERLMHAGKPAETPCAVIMRGATAGQRKICGTLATIADRADAAGLQPPSIIVVGAVAQFADTLNWFERKPLHGRNICITRSKEQAQELRERLLDLGAQVTELNTIRIAPSPENLREYLPTLADYQYLVFTSVNGVNVFFDYLQAQHYDIRQIKAAVASIGPATTAALNVRGIAPAVAAREFVAESLVEALRPVLTPGARVLVARSKQARPYLVDELRRAGCLVDEVHVYDVEPGQVRGYSGLDGVDWVVFTSPTTVRNLIELVGLEAVRAVRALAIGPITRRELAARGLEASVCEEYSVDGILRKLQEVVTDQRS